MVRNLIFSFLLLSPAAFAAPQNLDQKPEKAVSLETFFPRAGDVDPAMVQEDYREYGRDALYDYINGGAEVYLGLGFVKVGALDYVMELEEETYFTLDVYDMGKRVNAFGIFSAERYGDPPRVEMGVTGYKGGGALYFWSGRYYVKVRADCEGAAVDKILLKMAGLVSARLGDPGAPPPELDLFPKGHRVPASEKYASQNLLGLAFLRGFSCRYKEKKAEADLYLCRCESEKEAIRMEKEFMEKLKTPPTPSVEGDGFLYSDKYLGQGRFLRVGSYFAVARYAPEEGSEAGEWESGLTAAFYDGLLKAVMKEKTQNALKGLLGEDREDR